MYWYERYLHLVLGKRKAALGWAGALSIPGLCSKGPKQDLKTNRRLLLATTESNTLDKASIYDYALDCCLEDLMNDSHPSKLCHHQPLA
jgi:hypothetical protein